MIFFRNIVIRMIDYYGVTLIILLIFRIIYIYIGLMILII